MGVSVTGEHVEMFDKSGYFVLPGVIPEEHLRTLRLAADEGIIRRPGNLESFY